MTATFTRGFARLSQRSIHPPAAAFLMTLALCCATAQGGESYAVRAKAIYPMTAEHPGPIENGVMIVRDGKVAAIGKDLAIPADMRVIDASDESICPGFIDAAGSLIDPHRGAQSVSAAFDAVDAFDTYGDWRRVLAQGVTCAYLHPGEHRLASGRGAVVRLGGDPEARVLRAHADFAINLGVFGPPILSKPPFFASSDVAIEPGRMQRPDSRLGQCYEIERRALDAAAWLERIQRGEGGRFDYHGRSFAEAVVGKLPVRISVRQAVDIESAIKLAKTLGRAATLVGLTRGRELGEALFKAEMPLIVRVEAEYRGPDAHLGPDPLALEAGVRSAGGILAASGSRSGKSSPPIALSGAAGNDSSNLRLVAAMAMRGGASGEQALAAITRGAAEVLGVADRVGSLAVGRDADFVVIAGRPLDADAPVVRTYVAGREAYCAIPEPRAVAGDGTTEPQMPRPLIVKAGTIWIGNGEVIEDGAVLIEDGKIQSVGHRVPRPARARVIDAGRTAFVTPGFVDAHGHLGLGEMTTRADLRTLAGPDLPIHRAIGVAGEEFLRVARAGVTTVILAAYRSAANGSRVAAIKSYGQDRTDMVLQPLVGVKFSIAGQDPLLSTTPIKEALEACRKYDESWKKYDQELEKWKKEKESGSAARPKEETESKVEGDKPDPISGTWDFTIRGGPLPEPVNGQLRLRLTGSRVEGRAVTPGSGDETPVTGTFDGKELTLEIDQDTGVGKPTVKATLDKEDHLTGRLRITDMFSLEFDATRISKEPVELRIERKSRRTKDGRPAPPKVDENLEPLRPMLAGKAPALVEVQSGAEAVAVLKLFVDQFKIPVVLLGARDVDSVADEMTARKGQVSVVVPPGVMRERDGVPYNQAADLRRRGVTVAMQSDAEDGARALPLMGLFAVQQGLGGDDALRALTIDAARMYKIDHRVGSLEAGKDGDLLIYSGHPFDADSRLERVIVGGQEVEDDD